MNQNFTLLLTGFALVAVLSSSCKKEDPLVCTPDFHWQYAGIYGPDAWGTCYSNCAQQSQSPIDIAGAVVNASLEPLEQEYEAVPTKAKNLGHTVEFEYEPGSKLILDGIEYKLLQFHFHTASEHTVNGTRYHMEVHLVHQSASEELVAVGVLVEQGSENAFLAQFIDDLPQNEGDSLVSSSTLNIRDFFPADSAYYTYEGSKTTPSCNDVSWFVMKSPVQASQTQIDKIHALVEDNYRPIQPLDGREIREYN